MITSEEAVAYLYELSKEPYKQTLSSVTTHEFTSMSNITTSEFKVDPLYTKDPAVSYHAGA